MLISNLLMDKNVKKIEFPNLYQDLNILLAELIGWENLKIENDAVLVSQNNGSPQKFDLFDEKVIFPIAQKFNKKSTKINDVEWSCEYSTKDKKTIMIVSEQEELALAMAIVLEFCL